MEKLSNIVLIDGNNFLESVFYKTNGVLDDTKRLMLRCLEEYSNLGDIIFCFDHLYYNTFKLNLRDDGSFRMKKHKFKLNVLKDLVKNYNYAIRLVNLYRADDLIFTYIQDKVDNQKIYIVSNDKGLLSCVTDNVYQITNIDGTLDDIIDINKLVKRYNCSGELFSYKRALRFIVDSDTVKSLKTVEEVKDYVKCLEVKEQEMFESNLDNLTYVYVSEKMIKDNRSLYDFVL